ncbi:MAG: ATP-dependent helicase [Dehalococcoidia bacterium]
MNVALQPLSPNSVHWQIANAPDQYIRVLAGPGTGKTFGLQHRVARLLGDGVDASTILAATFTRAAANALRNDLASVGIPAAAQIEARTLHSLCFAALQRQRTMQSTGRVPRPLLDYEREPLLADLPDSFAGVNYSGTRRKERAIRAFEAAWAQLRHEVPGWPGTQHERDFHQALIDWLIFHRAMLIGEVVPTMLAYLRDNPDVGPRYAHTLVDEYQDLNRAEQELVNQLSGSGAQLVIGDDDQSIYTFKFAHPAGIIDYAQRLPGVLPLETDDCYRSPSLVVEMANALMDHQTHRLMPRTLQCVDRERPQDVDVVRWPSLDTEAQGVAKFVDAYLGAHGEIDPGRVLILSPRRQVGYMVRDELTEIGRESRSYFQEQELEDLSAQRAFTLLRLLVDPADRTAIRWWLGHGTTNWLTAAYSRLQSHCATSGEAPHDALGRLSAGQLSLPHGGRLVTRWKELVSELARLQNVFGMDLVDALFRDGDLGCALLRSAALEVVTQDMPPTVLLDRLGDMIRGPEVPEESQVIRVMSLHKSKGLTADLVVIVGLVDGLLPFTADDAEVPFEAQLEEQRRLFYVAMTRTRRVLLLSSGRRMRVDLARRMGMFRVPPGTYFDNQVSRFVSEVTPPAPATLTPEQLAAKYGFAL